MGVSKHKDDPAFLYHMQISPENTDVQGSIGDIWGCLNIWGYQGASKCMGVSECMGASKPYGGIWMPSSVKHTCL